MGATGTAVAVTTTHVNIADPTTPARIAHVDAAGRLTTAGATSSIDIPMTVSPNTTSSVSSPTTATLAITDLLIGDPHQNVQFNGSDYLIGLYATDAPATGNSCSPTGTTRLIIQYPVQPGDTVNQTFTAPIIVKPVAGHRYCLSVRVDSYGTPDGWFQTIVNVTAYVTSGTYTGIGTNGATSQGLPARPVTKAHR